jgi:hypothetical protein
MHGSASAPKVFISYSWEDEAHKRWVRDLAVRLREDGIETILDRWHAVPGDQLTAFMAKAIRESDFVLIVCTPTYKQKAESDAGGVRYEGDIIQGDVLLRGNHRKYIPILRRGAWLESAPAELRGKYRIDLREGPEYVQSYTLLLKTLHKQIELPPDVGEKPILTNVSTHKINVATVSADLSLSRGGVAISSDGRRAISISASNKLIGTGTMKVWDVEEARELRRLYIDDSHGDARLHAGTYRVAISSDGREILSGSKRLRIWDAERGTEQYTWWPEDGSIESIAMTPNGDVAVVTTGDELEVFDLRNRNPNDWNALKATKALKVERKWFETLLAVAVTAPGTMAVCGSSKGILRIWDIEKGRESRQLLGHGGSVKSVAITPDGKVAASASSDRTVKVWSLGSGRELCTFSGHLAAVNGVAITADGRLAVSVSDDRTVRIWDATSGREIHMLARFIREGAQDGLWGDQITPNIMAWG